PIGAGDAKAAVAVFDVGLCRFERLGRKRLAFDDDAPPGGEHRRAADERRARAHAADAVGAVGIALHDAHFFDWHAKHLHDELGVRGLEPLAHGLRPRENGYLAFRVDLDLDRFG